MWADFGQAGRPRRPAALPPRTGAATSRIASASFTSKNPAHAYAWQLGARGQSILSRPVVPVAGSLVEGDRVQGRVQRQLEAARLGGRSFEPGEDRTAHAAASPLGVDVQGLDDPRRQIEQTEADDLVVRARHHAGAAREEDAVVRGGQHGDPFREPGRMVPQSLDRRIASKAILVKEVKAWSQRRNREKAQIRWLFTVEEARKKLGRAYPSHATAAGRAAA